MTDREVMQMALEALAYTLDTKHEHFDVDKAQLLSHRAVEHLQQALAQPEQEPVCDKDPYYCGYVRCQLGKVCKNTAPPKREWVGLTDEDWHNLPTSNKQGCERDAEIFDWIEDKLKEKNK